MEKIKKQIAEHLGIEVLPIKFESIEDDSRLMIKEGYVSINDKYIDNNYEIAKCITHEYRHAFQFFYASLMNDDLASYWRSELANAKTSADDGYYTQALELDAFAFTKYYLEKYLGEVVIYPDEKYEEQINMYIALHSSIM